MNGKKITGILLLMLSLINIYIFLNRSRNYHYTKFSGYESLYPNFSKGIKDIYVHKDSMINLSLKGFDEKNRWAVLFNDLDTLAKGLGNNVSFPIKTRINHYKISFSKKDSILIHLGFFPEKIYSDKNRHVKTTYSINYCNYDFIARDTSTILKWKDDLKESDPQEKKAIEKLLRDSILRGDSLTTMDQIIKIASFIQQQTSQSKGIPSDMADRYSPFKQFQLARERKIELWCGNLSKIFHVFASANNIVTRRVGVMGRYASFSFGNHSLNECYIPETGKWVAVDITSNQLIYMDHSGNPLNIIDLYQQKKYQHEHEVKTISLQGDTLNTLPYSVNSNAYIWRKNDFIFPYSLNNDDVYNFPNKFIRYIFPVTWCEVYSESSDYDQFNFYVKIFFLYLWMINFMLFIFFIYYNSRYHDRTDSH